MLRTLILHVEWKTGKRCTAAVPTIARETGVSEGTVRSALKELHGLGILRYSRRSHGGRNTHVIDLDIAALRALASSGHRLNRRSDGGSDPQALKGTPSTAGDEQGIEQSPKQPSGSCARGAAFAQILIDAGLNQFDASSIVRDHPGWVKWHYEFLARAAQKAGSPHAFVRHMVGLEPEQWDGWVPFLKEKRKNALEAAYDHPDRVSQRDPAAARQLVLNRDVVLRRIWPDWKDADGVIDDTTLAPLTPEQCFKLLVRRARAAHPDPDVLAAEIERAKEYLAQTRQASPQDDKGGAH